MINDMDALPMIRIAAVGDGARVVTCIREAFEPYIERIGKMPAPMRLDVPALILDEAVWVAERESGIEGVLVQYETQDGFYVDTVASSLRSRGTGIGRELLKFAERCACERGYESLYLCTNSLMVENQRLYSRVGYLEFARESAGGYDRVFYRKQLLSQEKDERTLRPTYPPSRWAMP
jgi:GNAT superfamily N-acetyltransferase